MNEIYFLVLGWLFGLLGPLIVSGITNEYRRREIKSGIIAELHDVQSLMPGIVCFNSMRFGTYDKELIRWLLPVYESYKGEIKMQNQIDTFNAQLNMDDAQFTLLSESLRAEPEGGISVKKYTLPYLESKVGELSLFNNKFQRTALDILSSLHIYNEEVEEARFYFRLTYQPDLSEGNYDRASYGVEASYRHLGDRAKIIVNRINQLN